MKRKKIVILVVIIILIILLSIIVIFKKNIYNKKYSNEDIYILVKKGVNNMQNLQNVCIERKNNMEVIKYCYKGNKMKKIIKESNKNIIFSYSITDLDKGMEYVVLDDDKSIFTQKTNYLYKGLQFDVLNRIEPSDRGQRIELSYIKDENISGKDCIFVKEVIYYKNEDGSFETSDELDDEVKAYWIEKETGFILGGVMISPDEKESEPEFWLTSIEFDCVTDDEFNLPEGYKLKEAD